MSWDLHDGTGAFGEGSPQFKQELLVFVAGMMFDLEHGPYKTWDKCSQSGQKDYINLAEVALTAAYQYARTRGGLLVERDGGN